MMNGIDIKNITRTIQLPDGKRETIFRDFSLSVRATERIGIFGPNGCGKTTLLNLIAGIISPDSGKISIFGRSPLRSKIAYIFQNYRESLFPWLTVRQNILFPLSIGKCRKPDMEKKFEHLASQMRIPFHLSQYPYQLRGGQQQYTALMRGLISDPAVMLIDEPFSALDHGNRAWLMNRITGLFDMIRTPVIVVSHNLEELDLLTDKVYVLSEKPARILEEKQGPQNPGGMAQAYFNVHTSRFYAALAPEKKVYGYDGKNAH